MKILMTTLTMTLMSLLLTNGAFADAADDVTAAEMDSRAQEDAGNIDATSSTWFRSSPSFPRPAARRQHV
jgi:hypothetical protein